MRHVHYNAGTVGDLGIALADVNQTADVADVATHTQIENARPKKTCAACVVDNTLLTMQIAQLGNKKLY